MADSFGSDTPGIVDLIETLHTRVGVLEGALEAATAELALRAEVDVIVAHEIRTPLTVVMGVFETVAAGLLNRTDCGLLVAAGLRHSRAAHATIEDLMRPGVHPGQLASRATLEVVDLAEVIADVIDSTTRLGGRPTSISASGFDLRITSAPARVRAILGNFVQNAVRFGRGTPVECQARIVDRTLELVVSDRGPGLQGEHPDMLFDPHSNGPAPRLGLYIARMIARSLGGDAFVAERDGGGTTAWATLPQRRPEDTVQS